MPGRSAKIKPDISFKDLLTSDQLRIIKAVSEGEQCEGIMKLIGATVGHHVYEYIQVQRLIDIIKILIKRPPLSVKAAQRLRICRICQIDNMPGQDNPLVLSYGKEYAHAKCLNARNP